MNELRGNGVHCLKNRYEVRGEVTAIFCNGNGVTREALIDTEKLELIRSFPNSWMLHGRNYVKHEQTKRTVKQRVFLHRIIASPPPDKYVDHINGNPLDNRNVNLRVCSHSENLQNQTRRRSDNSSGHRGVYYNKRQGVWGASCCVNNKRTHLGFFATRDDAGAAAALARKSTMPFSPEATMETNNAQE